MGNNSRKMEVLNKYTQQPAAEISVATKDDVNKAVASAKEALKTLFTVRTLRGINEGS